jgi:hypothetical protein
VNLPPHPHRLCLSARARLALPCIVCVSGADSTLQQGINAGVLTLLAITSVVLLPFAVFVARIAWRSRRTERQADSRA